ncbi:MAG: indole-3-glycerol phosphate synthase TrpC [Fusobacteriaceae bacterium]
MKDILNKIVLQKKIDLVELKKNIDYEKLKSDALSAPLKRSFKDSLKKNELSIIGEIKKASPSKGVIKDIFNPIELLKNYNSCVDAVSILTEEKFFLGSPLYLLEASKNTDLPLLRKDFIIDEIQIYEAKLLGASAILLICSILTLDEIKKFLKLAKELKLDALVEVHSEEDLKIALEADAEIIGINNRNLDTFEVSISTTIRLLDFIPDNKIIVSESGFHTIEDIKIIKGSRVDAILVGESFMRSEDMSKHSQNFKNTFK